MSHVFPEHKKRRAVLVGVVGIAALATGLTAAAFASGSNASGSTQVVVCPAPVLPAVPAGAQAEVTRNLGELDKQIAEANKRLVDTVGQGGANFAENAIVGPLEDKRTAVLNRIETAIGRQAAKPEGLEAFARCELGAPGQAAPAPSTTVSGSAAADPAAGVGVVDCPTPVIPDVPAGAQDEVTRNLGELDKQIAEANKRLVDTVGQGGANFAENAIVGPLEDKRTAVLNRIETAIGRLAAKPEGLEKFARCELSNAGETAPAPSAGTGQPASSTAPAAGGGGAIACPSPVDAIPAVPAGAQAEVTRELANLDNQIAEADKRLVDTKGQGGANFVDNAILGPLKDKRVAALNRIETAIGRLAAKPEGLERFAPCALR